MAGLRRAFFLTIATAALLATPAAGGASDDSVSIADTPQGDAARARAWTTPPPGGRSTAPRTPRVRMRPRRVVRPATPRWIEVPSQPAPAVVPATPAPTESTPPTNVGGEKVILDGQLVDKSAIVLPVAPAAAPRAQSRGNRRGRVRRVANARRNVQFRFAVGDEILISIWDDDVESGTIDLRQRILRDGTISPLWLDPIQVRGRTIAEVRGELVEAYKEYYKIPRITVGVESVHLERAFVLGEVEEPAAVELNGPQTLLQVLAQAGGITPTLGSKTVRVLRSRGPGCRPRIFTVNTERTLCGRGRSFMVMPGDVVYVHPTGLANWNRTLTTALAPLQALFGASGGAAATFLAFDELTTDDNTNNNNANNNGN